MPEAVRSFLTRPVYEGTASLLIERADPNVVAFKDVSQVDAARDDYYQTQYGILRSRALVRHPLIRALGLVNRRRKRSWHNFYPALCGVYLREFRAEE